MRALNDDDDIDLVIKTLNQTLTHLKSKTKATPVKPCPRNTGTKLLNNQKLNFYVNHYIRGTLEQSSYDHFVWSDKKELMPVK